MWSVSYVDKSLGQTAHDEFAKLLLDPVDASEDEDIYNHWDIKGIFSDLSGLVLRFDVKELKPWSRKQKVFPVELQNVLGEKGWVYGDADCIAYMHPSSFTVVWRSRLVDLIEMMMSLDGIDKNMYVTDKRKWLPLGSGSPGHQIYRREKWDRDDRVVMLRAEDMWSISSARPLKRDDQLTRAKMTEKRNSRKRSKALGDGSEG